MRLSGLFVQKFHIVRKCFGNPDEKNDTCGLRVREEQSLKDWENGTG